MKKAIIYCAVSWIVLAAMVAGLLSYVSQMEVIMEAPAAQLLTGEDNKLTIQWQLVEYATSYRVYRMNKAGDWELLKAVSADVNSYALPADSLAEDAYAVRACHVSSITGTTLSKYSRATVGEK